MSIVAKTSEDVKGALSDLDEAEEHLNEAIEALRNACRKAPTTLRAVANAYIIPHLEAWVEGDHQPGNLSDLRERLKDDEEEEEEEEKDEGKKASFLELKWGVCLHRKAHAQLDDVWAAAKALADKLSDSGDGNDRSVARHVFDAHAEGAMKDEISAAKALLTHVRKNFPQYKADADKLDEALNPGRQEGPVRG
jgi:hypothetical protein